MDNLEIEYEEEIFEITDDDLLSQVPTNSVAWFSNAATSIVGVSSEFDISPSMAMYNLLKYMHEHQSVTVRTILFSVGLKTYLIDSNIETQ